MNTLIVQGPQLDKAQVTALIGHIQTSGIEVIAEETGRYRLTLSAALDQNTLNQLRQQFPFDINQLPTDFEPDKARLLLTDMDSTLINIECIDEIADFLAIKPQVAEITEAAMRGEIDFETSLQRRMELLLGLDDSALLHVYNERLKLNPGAEVMLRGLQQNNIKVALVSGGFTFFTERLQQRLNLDFTLANELAFDAQGKLTGLNNDIIVGAQRKASYLDELCAHLSINANQVIAMGDGANDLLMMAKAGLSVAYHAKPTVQQQASCTLNHCGLEGVLGLLGI